MTTETAAPRLDERALRRPDWTPGVPIVLSDGQTWTFPRPVPSGDYYFRLAPEAGFELTPGFEDHAYEGLYEDYLNAAEGAGQLRALAALALHLLRRNYDLAPGDLRHLLRVGGDADAPTWGALARLVLGRDPEPAPSA